MHVLWETDRWLQNYCVANSSEVTNNASEENASEGTADAEAKAVGTAGGVAEEPDHEPDTIHIMRKSSLW